MYYPRLSKLVEISRDSDTFKRMIRIAYETYGGINNDLDLPPPYLKKILNEARKTKRKKRKKQRRRNIGKTPIFGYWGWVGYYPHDTDTDDGGSFDGIDGSFDGGGGDGGFGGDGGGE